MKHAVSTLEGALLDAAVAKAAGVVVETIGYFEAPIRPRLGVWDQADGLWRGWNPSTDWRDGGQIIERERIALMFIAPDRWRAYMVTDRMGLPWGGPTALAAAMRAYVASKFGEEVELP